MISQSQFFYIDIKGFLQKNLLFKYYNIIRLLIFIHLVKLLILNQKGASLDDDFTDDVKLSASLVMLSTQVSFTDKVMCDSQIQTLRSKALKQ